MEKLKFRVIKFYKIQFDENWKQQAITNQIFSYISTKRNATVKISFEGPIGKVFTVQITSPVERKAYIHRDVIHIFGICTPIKEDKICDND
jgi:hypothetical protein